MTKAKDRSWEMKRKLAAYRADIDTYGEQRRRKIERAIANDLQQQQAVAREKMMKATEINRKIAPLVQEYEDILKAQEIMDQLERDDQSKD